MSHLKFKFESIDIEKKSIVVRFINPYGPIESGKTTIEELTTHHEIPTGDFYGNGTPIMEKFTTQPDNPNEDIIWNYDIPIDENGNLFDKQKMIDFLSNQNYHNLFDQYKIKQESNIDDELINSINEIIHIEIPEPVSSNIEESDIPEEVFSHDVTSFIVTAEIL